MKYGLMAVIVLLALPSCCMRKENGKPPRRARRMTTERVPMEVTPMDQEMMIDETMTMEPAAEPMMTETESAVTMEAMPSEADMEIVEEEEIKE